MTFVIVSIVGVALAAAGYLFVRGRSGDVRRENAGEPGAPPPMSEHEIGRQHIDQALDRLYPTQRDYRFGVSAEPGEDEAPLAEIVAYRASTPVPHWHYITYGLSELGEKTSNEPSLSGFGVEYTLRLVDDAAEPPIWPMNLLRWLAKLVWQTREPLDPKHSMDVPDGLLDEVSPGVEGLAFLTDPDLATIQTPNGTVTFVSAIPLMAREHWLLGAWDFDKYVDVLCSQQSDLLWRVGRRSVLESDGSSEILARVERDGSSQSVDFTTLSWRDGELLLDQVSRTVLGKFLRYRLAYGRDASIVSGEQRTTLSPGEWAMQCSSTGCSLSIPPEEARTFAADLDAMEDGATVVRPGGARFRFEVIGNSEPDQAGTP